MRNYQARNLLRDEVTELRRVGVDATSVKSDIDLDQHIHLLSRGHHGFGPATRHIHVIDDERKVGTIQQPKHAVGVRRIQRIGQPDVIDSGVGEHFCFAQLGAADAYCAAAYLQAREIGGFVSFRVRAQAQSVLVCSGLHPIDVALDARLIDQYARGAEIREFHAGEVYFDARLAD